MASTQLFRRYQQNAVRDGEPRTEARTGDPAADNQDIALLHRGDGYGLESHSV